MLNGVANGLRIQDYLPIFIRYKIINTGIVSDLFDSVYFSVFADPDIGTDYRKDLTGCDSLLNAGFVYKDSACVDFGDNPPCLLIDIINVPISYIPNITFQDVNNNSIYDTEDIPLDSTFNVKGKYFGTKKYLGAKNLRMSSFNNFNRSTIMEDPELRDYRL